MDWWINLIILVLVLAAVAAIVWILLKKSGKTSNKPKPVKMAKMPSAIPSPGNKKSLEEIRKRFEGEESISWEEPKPIEEPREEDFIKKPL